MAGRWIAALAAVTMACAGVAKADTFVLTNTTHPELYGASGIIIPSDVDGNGTATPVAGGFTIKGPDITMTMHPVLVANTTSMVATALSLETLTFNWTYNSQDVFHDALYDPGGYLLNGVLTKLTTNGVNVQGGAVTFNLNPGDTYGFYVSSTDSSHGAGFLTFTSAPVPEPATWAMMIVGLGMVGAGMRMRRVTKALPTT